MADKPDITVSIDLGTTYTGVAWMTPKTPIQVISDWPGSGDRGERKVPTTLIYNADGTLSSWGFMCDDDDETLPSKFRRDFFKIFIDEETLVAAQQRGFANVPKNPKEAQQFATEYLRQVYIHVKETVETQIGKRHFGGWTDMTVTFLFSVPTTWTRMEIINIFKGIIRDAGFGVEGPRHMAQVDLTEAEAAAVATLKTSAVSFNHGSLFLTVDAGGGTTDLALMRVTSRNVNFPQMAQMSAVKGVGIGSTLIDRAFVRLVMERLAGQPDIQRQLPKDFAVRLSKSHHFKILKHKFGEKVYMQPVFKIQMEGVSHSFSHAGLGVENGRMLFTMAEIQSLFDIQIEGIMKRITEQLNWLSEHGQPQQVEYMILSGGLGSSPYVRDKIQQQLLSYPHINATQVAVVPCHDPQLVVVRGLLLDHQQRTETGNIPVLAARIARSSYGIVVREMYSPATHFDEDVVQDPWNRKKKWAANQIQWLIRKGDIVDPNVPLVKTFEYRLGPNDTTRSWNADIVVSQNEASFLPKSLKQAGVTKLCRVRSNLDGVEQHQLLLKQKRVTVAPADLRFELWFDGQKFSGNHEPVTPQWSEAGLKVNQE
ncbi:hsp70 family chaperone [Trichoderma arundinaceum]|uniref:Hsp70 family chaperone n=1 Tax=Trichoderma arundinaceum TaxID=490622 RepID=A0A395NVD9_TRIAR|nr:hsp70 family chaperone [Trichoderma arundinaceum]